jgi:hypothetical protein
MFDDKIPQDMFNRLKKVGQQSKGFGIQEIDRPHVDEAYDESLHTNKLQRACLDPPKPRL